jgi:CRP-like cAMP-binding protein
MNQIPQSPSDCPNLLLSMLDNAAYQALLPRMEVIETPLSFVLFQRDQPIRHAYFPLSGAHSILASMQDGSTVEVGTVGYEGFSTVDLLLGADLAIETTVCEIPGFSLRIPANTFRQLTLEDTPLRRIALRYLQSYMSMVSQSVACNRLHILEHRLARWLLMSHDRARRQDFTLTQEYIATMLGVQRPSVTLAAGILQRAGIIEYKRGLVRVLDREALESASCECYALVRKQYERILGRGF